MDDYELIDNEERHQYEFHIGKYVPKIEYIKTKNGEIYLTHTEVPVALEGKGVGSQLAEKVLKDIENKNCAWFRCVLHCRIHPKASGLATHSNERY